MFEPTWLASENSSGVVATNIATGNVTVGLAEPNVLDEPNVNLARK